MGSWSVLAVVLAVATLGCKRPGGCAPETDQAFCERHGKDCGTYADFDNCGASRMAGCGTCGPMETCGGGGIANACAGPMVDAGPDVAQIVLRVTITDNPDILNGEPTTDAFDLLEDMTIECRSSIPSLTRTTSGGSFELHAYYDGRGANVVCSGSDAPVLRDLQDGLDDPSSVVRIQLDTDPEFGSPPEARISIVSPDAPEMFAIWGSCTPSPAFPVDADGFGVLAPFVCDAMVGVTRLRDSTLYMTDQARGDGALESDAM